MNWTAKYVGLPFVDHGRDFKGVDCWGLVRLIMQEECGIELQSYGETSALDLATVAGIVKDQSATEPWLPVIPNDRLCAFDVAVMYHRRDPIHIGIMASSSHIIHIEEKISAVIIPITHVTIRFRYPKFFRHREMIARAA